MNNEQNLTVNFEGKTLMVMAGGTGGHIFPGLAIAKEFEQLGGKVFWLGSVHGLEKTIIPEHKIPIEYLSVEGFRGKGRFTKFLAPFKVLYSVLDAALIMWRIKPDVVIGFGGFASGPGGIASWILRIPLIIHEQNSIPGSTNNILSRFAHVALEGFPNSFKKLDAQYVGNPVRKEIGSKDIALPPRQSTTLRLLVIGGSRGARAINEVLPQALSKAKYEKIEVVHQTGESLCDETKELYKSAGVHAHIVPFIKDMAGAYEWCDVVIARAGASTIAELTIAGRGAVLIPFPYAIDDHQTTNALYMKDKKAAVLIPQNEFEPNAFAEFINYLLSHRDYIIDMAKNAKQLGIKDSISKIMTYIGDTA